MFELDPSFRAPNNRAWSLDVELGDCLAQTERFKDAIEQYKRVLGRGTTDAEVYRKIGESYMALGQLERASEAYTKAHLLGYHPALTAFGVASAHARLGDDDVAFQWLDRAVELDRPGLTASLVNDPDIESLRLDPRFPDLAQLKADLAKGRIEKRKKKALRSQKQKQLHEERATGEKRRRHASAG